MNAPSPSLAPLPEAVLRAIVEQASDGIFVTDAALRIEWVNEAARTLLGHSTEYMVGKLIAELVEPADLATAPLRSRDLQAGVPTRTVRRFRTPTGAVRLLEVSATAIGDGRMLGIARDVTDRHAQERLTRTEESFRTLIEASPDAVIVHRDSRICYLNASAVRILGLADARAGTGLHILDVVHPGDRAWARRRIASLDQQGSTTPFSDTRFLRGDGQTIVLSVGGVRVVFEGEPSTVAVARDVSDQRRLQHQLAQADRMASLGTLAAGVGHEINNPLAYVMLSLEAITRFAAQAEPELARPLAEHAANAFDGARRVAKIVRDLRTFSRLDDEIRTVVDVRRALEVALSTASHELKHRARVSTTLDEVAPVVGSEGRLAQIFLNLLVNAAQAVPAGAVARNTISLYTLRDAQGRVCVEVRDTGPAVTPESQRRLFEPFFTTKGQAESTGTGTGLGLAICRSIIESLGGEIQVEGVPGTGSTFRVLLPPSPEETWNIVRPPEAVPVRVLVPDPQPNSEPIGPRGRVLIVDDEPLVRMAAARTLQSHHEVVEVSSGAAALARLEAGERYDAILCDLMMPELTGMELHAVLSRQIPDQADRMLFLTGGAFTAGAQTFLDNATRPALEKPFKAWQLRSAVAAVIAERGLLAGKA